MEIRTLSIKSEEGGNSNLNEGEGNNIPILHSPLNHSLIIDKFNQFKSNISPHS
jgi:hypothetical protein